MNNRLKFFLVGLLVVGSMGYLIISGIQATGMRYTTVAELHELDLTDYEQHVKVTGKAVPGSIDYDPQDTFLRLRVEDETEETVRVEYDGIRPDALQDGAGVIIEGYYDSDEKVVEAYTLLAKCPSRYESELDASSSYDS